MPSDGDRLEDLLNAVGREAQPAAFGWETLPARLARMPQRQPGQLGRWATLPIGVAAVAAVAAVLLWMLLPRQRAQAVEQPIEVRRESVDLTILSIAETEGETLYMPILGLVERPGSTRRKLSGQALVKDRRLVLNLKAGDNLVRFTDIAATIDPTSVRFESLTDPKGTTVVEQGFEYDLATADALLKRFLDKPITCVDRGGQETAGNLASFDEATIVLSPSPGAKDAVTQNVSRQSLAAVRLSEQPSGLIVKPTLVWKLRAAKPGAHRTQLTYLCGFVQWHADYVVQVTPGEGGAPDTLDFAGWVTLENTSGSSYPQAGLRLIAGDVRRLPELWRRPEKTDPVLSGAFVESGDLRQIDGEWHRFSIHGADLREFKEQVFFEYHLYALNTPCTVGDHQIKQLSFLKHAGVKATRRYVFEPAEGSSPLAVELVVKNDKDNKLGLPLPKGNVTLEQRGPDGEPAAVGRTEIDHTAVKEELKLRYAHAFDVIAEHREVLVEKLNQHSRITYETRIRNHKATAVTVKCYAVSLGSNGTLRQASMPYQTEDARTLYFQFTLAANAEQTVRYTIVYRSDKSWQRVQGGIGP